MAIRKQLGSRKNESVSIAKKKKLSSARKRAATLQQYVQENVVMHSRS